MAGTLTDVTDSNFQAEVIESDKPVLVDFWAAWCGPCRVVAPVLEEIASERDDLRIVKLDVDANQQTAANYEVLSIPTMILFKNGQPAKKIIGAYPKKRLESELESSPRGAPPRNPHLPLPRPPRGPRPRGPVAPAPRGPSCARGQPARATRSISAVASRSSARSAGSNSARRAASAA